MKILVNMIHGMAFGALIAVLYNYDQMLAAIAAAYIMGASRAPVVESVS